tara:strand:- start:3561 stop:4022 length:462 start_codon:yes stop_codon:yes gene_type:complete
MSKLKQRILTIAIAIIFVLFIGYGIQTFYPGPEYEDFCEEKPMPVPRTLDEAGELEKSDLYEEQKECRDNFENARQSYDRIVFILSVIFGAIAIGAGVMLKLKSVSAGLMAGGVLTIVYGAMRYWSRMSDYLRFVLLGVVLVGLIWLGYKKLK